MRIPFVTYRPVSFGDHIIETRRDSESRCDGETQLAEGDVSLQMGLARATRRTPYHVTDNA
eukprot:11810901-Heterocapsa_arctica.AAC.1